MRALLVIAGLLVAVGLLANMGGEVEAAAPGSAGKIEVVSLACTAKTSHTDVDATIRNVGAVTIKYPALFVRVAGVVDEGIAKPMTLPPGALGTVRSTGPDSGAARGTSVPCEVVAAQDSSGRSIL